MNSVDLTSLHYRAWIGRGALARSWAHRERPNYRTRAARSLLPAQLFDEASALKSSEPLRDFGMMRRNAHALANFAVGGGAGAQRLHHSGAQDGATLRFTTARGISAIEPSATQGRRFLSCGYAVGILGVDFLTKRHYKTQILSALTHRRFGNTATQPGHGGSVFKGLFGFRRRALSFRGYVCSGSASRFNSFTSL